MHMTNEEHSHCGCGCGGHDHEHEHSHEHTHDGVTHTHAHTHEGEHQHDHTHGECGCGHHHGEQPKDEDTAVLAYMLDHNRHHAQELAAIAKHLREQGKDDISTIQMTHEELPHCGCGWNNDPHQRHYGCRD